MSCREIKKYVDFSYLLGKYNSWFFSVVRRKTIYEYHRVNMKGKKIESQTAIYLQALPRCNSKTTCRDCLSLTVHDDGRDIQVIEFIKVISPQYTH